jgi:hypothetical protein
MVDEPRGEQRRMTSERRLRGFEMSVNPGRGGAWQVHLGLPGGGPGRYRDIRVGKHCLTLNGPWFAPCPRPDRSGIQRNFAKTADNDVLDIGWAEGKLPDGRPYFAELWARDQVTSVTVFFSRTNLERLTDDSTASLLEQYRLVKFRKRHCGVTPWTDSAGNKMWSVNLVVGDADKTYLTDRFRFFPYRPPTDG